jgi:hypothetical protein
MTTAKRLRSSSASDRERPTRYLVAIAAAEKQVNERDLPRRPLWEQLAVNAFVFRGENIEYHAFHG